MNYYLGIDCGGTFVKAALFDEKGNLHGIARENVSVMSEKAGYAERDMAQLWAVTAGVVKEAIAKSGVNSTAAAEANPNALIASSLLANA